MKTLTKGALELNSISHTWKKKGWREENDTI